MKKNLLLNGMAFLMCLFLFAGAVYAQNQKTVRVESDGTWQVPTTLEGNPIEVTSVTFEAWGGGGAGGFCEAGSGLTPKLSGGGGGGAYGKTVISNPTAGESFLITIGQGGYNKAESDGGIVWKYKNHQVADGGQTVVKRGTTTIILEANGGKTCAMNTGTGAQGGAATGTGDVHHAGGKGGNAKTDCTLPGRRSSGGGGGAGYADGNGGDGGNGICDPTNGGGAGGTSGGNGGKGGNGVSDISVGKSGSSFGGGGAGSKSGEAWHSGGAGAKGGVVITYTYTATAAPSITVNNTETTICSGNEYDAILDVTLINVDPSTVSLIPNAVSVPGLSFASPTLSYEGGEFHLKGTATNTTSGTLTATMANCKLKAGSVESDAFTFTLNVYGKLDGGVIAADQFVCNGKEIMMLKGDGEVVTWGTSYSSVTTSLATGGSGNGTYQWRAYDYLNGSGFENIPNANAANYTPTENGMYGFQRFYTDNQCGTVWATDGHGWDYIEMTTVDPFVFDAYYSGDDTICVNENYTKVLGWAATTPAYNHNYGQYWQMSIDKGEHWDDLGFTIGYTPYTVSLTPANYSANGGDDIWFRAAVKMEDCDSIPANTIYKIHVTEVPDYTGQFPDVNITLWYGACDTNIANLAAPTLTPTPASVTRADSYTTVDTGTYIIKWNVIADDCNIPVEYEQKVVVAFPTCGSKVSDADGYEYETVRVGCDCWIAENLKTNATDGVYYDEDDANETFGKLYNWNDAVAVNNTEKTAKTGNTYLQGICPDGWAIPTTAQFNTMLAAAGGDAQAVKSDDQSTWLPGEAGTNTSGFGAKAAGYYEANQFQRQLGYTYFWTSELNSSNSLVAKTMELRCGCGEFTCIEKSKESKVSVRCVRIEPAE